MADDDRGVRTLLVRVLGAAGYAVVAARDGLEAQQLLRELCPHLVILDLRMPHLSGIELLAATADVPVIVLSGYLGDLPDSPLPNVVARLEKPVSLDALRDAVRRVLDG